MIPMSTLAPFRGGWRPHIANLDHAAGELVDKIVSHKAMLTALNGSLIFQVHIRISSYQCGGVLLNHLYVATAAHCVHQAKLSQITVHLGEYDTKDTEEVCQIL